MNQEQLLAKRDELTQEYHLGEIELYHTPMTSRDWAIFVAGAFGCLLLTTAFGFGLVFVASFSHHSLIIGRPPLDLIAQCALIFVVGFFIAYVIYSLTHRTSVYVYTSGLVCLGQSGGRVVHWEEIGKIDLQRGDSELPDRFTVYLNDGTRIRFTNLSSRG